MTNQIDPSDFVYSEVTETYSTWKNNNKDKATFRLLMHTKRRGVHKQFGADCQGSEFLRVDIEPGQSVKLLKEFDQAIRTVDQKTGLVVGGLCPWLTKEGEENLVVHKSLDYMAAFQEEEAMNYIQAVKKENELKDALKEIEKRKISLTNDQKKK